MFRNWIASIVLALTMLLPLTGCGTVPATGRSAFILIDAQQEARIGTEAAPEFLKSYGGPIPDPHVQQYVTNIGMSMARLSESPDLEWEFHTIDSAVINAFALPGGKVFVSRGLMERFQSDAELAGVLGHEIGHVTGRHGAQRISQAIAIQATAAALAIGGEVSDNEALRYLGYGASAGGSIYLLKNSRDHESEADALGLRYMTRAGYHPVGLLRVLEVLRGASGGGGQIEWLSTHPAPDTRLRRVEAIIRQDHPDFESEGAGAWGFDSYRANVLERLKQLPPARHR